VTSEASTYTKPLRELAALVLVAANAAILLVALIGLVPNAFETFTARSNASFSWFVGLDTIGFPVLATLLVTHFGGLTARAKVITTLALAELAVSAFFGLVFGFFVGLVSAADGGFRPAFEAFLGRGAWLAVLGVAGYVVFTVWRNVFPPAPRGQAPGNWGGYPQGQQPYGQPQGQPHGSLPYPPQNYPPQAPPAQGYPQPGPGYPQPEYGQPGPGYGQPDQGYGQPTTRFNPPPAEPPAYPASGPPAGQHGGNYPPPPPNYGPPAGGPGAPGASYADPTEAFGRREDENR
jgi:hypothetical protein